MAETALMPWHRLADVFVQPWWLFLAICLPVFWLCWRVGNHRRKSALRSWFNDHAVERDIPHTVKRCFLSLAALCLVISTAGPLWGTNPLLNRLSSRHLFIVLDVSRSMLAEDQPPLCRLDRAKARVLELIELLTRQGCRDRVGLIIFAGQARLLCPLTTDYDHVRYCLALAHPDLLGRTSRLTHEEPHVGTDFLPAINLTVTLAELEPQPLTDCLLITDGDDLAGATVPAAQRMHAARTRWHLFGVGDPVKPAWIPSGNAETPFVLIQDPRGNSSERATTVRRDNTLREMATLARASLLLENVEPLPLVAWWLRTETDQTRITHLSDPRSVHLHQYSWFLTGALVFLVLEFIGSDWLFRRKPCQPIEPFRAK